MLIQLEMEEKNKHGLLYVFTFVQQALTNMPQYTNIVSAYS